MMGHQQKMKQMSIKWKLLLVIIPLQVSTIIVTAFFALLSARSGITHVAMDALAFKALELNKYITSQWDILVKNDLSTDIEFVGAAKRAVNSYSTTLQQSDTESVYIFDVNSNEAKLAFTSKEEVLLTEEDLKQAKEQYDTEDVGWKEITLESTSRVAQIFRFVPFNWLVIVSEEYNTFYSDAEKITTQSSIIALISLVAVITLSLIFIAYITSPLRKTVSAMVHIIEKNDLSTKIEVQENDEFGQMAQTFNIMTDKLDTAYSQIKSYAFNAVVAKRNESKIRNIFQKYVPNNVIDSIFENPERMLVGENRNLSVMFTDIRSFTTISEGLRPDILVSSLNKYYSIMVDLIMNQDGIVDKYIGDAIMAIFGAPNHLKNSAHNAVTSAFHIQDALVEFNKTQTKKGFSAFETGIGIAYGKVTVGNIGSERKMDYTVIGDTVNLGSRLESLTKRYKTGLLFSHPVYEKIKKLYSCRVVDTVFVKGKTIGERIYTAQKSVSGEVQEAWNVYHLAVNAYYNKDFDTAVTDLKEVAKMLPDDLLANVFLERSLKCQKDKNLPKDWTGIETLTTK